MKDVEYLNSTVYCTLAPSKIHRVGVVAVRDIPAHTAYTDYTIDSETIPILYTLNEEEFNQLYPEIQSLILDRVVLEDQSITFISPNSDAILRSFMNHSSNPNTDGTLTLKAITAGEELTENYFTLVQNIHPRSQAHFKDLV